MMLQPEVEALASKDSHPVHLPLLSWHRNERCNVTCRILKEERNYILQMIKKIRASGANVLLIQKSILRDAVTDLSLHYLVMPLSSPYKGYSP